MNITFTVPGRIRGKGRPRATVRGGFARMYTDVKTKSDEAMVRHFASEAMMGRDIFEGPLQLNISIAMNAPQSWSKKRRANTRWVTGKPDCDNVQKLVSDAMNGIVYRDDSQIAASTFWRKYTEGPERVTVMVVSLDEIEAQTASRAA